MSRWRRRSTGAATSEPDHVELVRRQLGDDRLNGIVTAMNQAADVPTQLFAAGMNAIDTGGVDRSPIGGGPAGVANSIPRVAGRFELIAVSERRVSWFVVSGGAPKCIATVARPSVAMIRTGARQTGYTEVRFRFDDGSFVLYLCSDAELVAGFWLLVA